MKQLLIAANSDRTILLLKILQTIARSKHTKTACSKRLQFAFRSSETGRLNTIYKYIPDNFSHEITLEEIAKIANMSQHSFCRYFKSRIKKTFSKFLLEVRIGHSGSYWQKPIKRCPRFVLKVALITSLISTAILNQSQKKRRLNIEGIMNKDACICISGR